MWRSALASAAAALALAGCGSGDTPKAAPPPTQTTAAPSPSPSVTLPPAVAADAHATTACHILATTNVEVNPVPPDDPDLRKAADEAAASAHYSISWDGRNLVKWLDEYKQEPDTTGNAALAAAKRLKDTCWTFRLKH